MAFTQFLQGQRNRFKKLSASSSSSLALPSSAPAQSQPQQAAKPVLKPSLKQVVTPPLKQVVVPVVQPSPLSTTVDSAPSLPQPLSQPSWNTSAPALAPLPLGLDPVTAATGAPEKAPPMVHTMLMLLRLSLDPLTELPPALPRGVRRLSERMKATPSLLHRHLRVFTPSSPYGANGANGANGGGSLGALRALALHAQFNRQVTELLPPPLRPIVTLLHAHRLRIYNVGVFQVPGYTSDGERVWLEVEAKLTGTELAIWRPQLAEEEAAFTEFRPKYINIVDAKINVVNSGALFELKIQTDYTPANDVIVRFHDSKDYVKWLAALYLARFEHDLLNEAYTAVILSLRGAQLADIHVLLAQKKRFPSEEWCNVRWPQISDRWLKVFVVIVPGDSKHLGRMELYASDKISKRNLVAYVDRLDQVYNVYPELPAMIDFNAIMALNGDIYVNKHFEHLFDAEMAPPQRLFTLKGISRSDSWHSLSSLKSDATPPATPKNHHRRTNLGLLTLLQLFFSLAPSPQPPTSHKHKGRRHRAHTLAEGENVQNTPKRTLLFVKKNLDQFATTSHCYLMPLTHPGVPAIETMIRNYIHIIDAFKLYGRPKQLALDKLDPQLLLFALPLLPHYQYLSRDALTKLVDKKLTPAIEANWDYQRWRQEFKAYLRDRVLQGYRGHGDVLKLYQNLDYSVFDAPFSPTLPDDGYLELAYTLLPPLYLRLLTPATDSPVAVDLDYDTARKYTALPLLASFR